MTNTTTDAHDVVSDAVACVLAMEHGDTTGMAALFGQYTAEGHLGELVIAILSVAHNAVRYAAHVSGQEPGKLLAGAIQEIRDSASSTR